MHIRIIACGVCHYDVNQARSQFGDSIYPLVPGHEIVGIVYGVGSKVTKFKMGDKAAVGIFVDSCRTCTICTTGYNQYCPIRVPAYNGRRLSDKSPTYGGYAKDVVCEVSLIQML